MFFRLLVEDQTQVVYLPNFLFSEVSTNTKDGEILSHNLWKISTESSSLVNLYINLVLITLLEFSISFIQFFNIRTYKYESTIFECNLNPILPVISFLNTINLEIETIGLKNPVKTVEILNHGEINDISFTNDYISVHNDGYITLYNNVNEKIVKEFKVSEKEIRSCNFSKYEKFLMTAYFDKKIIKLNIIIKK